ncbi:phosphatase PAP2 family protein [Myxococcaceae bacterium GXIMD 01537]
MRATLRRNVKVVLPLALLQGVGYVLLNRHHLREPTLLPLTALDRDTPFLVWTVWAYAALLSSDFLLPLFIRDGRVLNDAIRAFLVVIAVNFAVWAAFPTSYPRPPPPQGDSLSERFYRLLVAADTPTNCLPSSHIAIPAVSLWALSREHPRRAPLLWAGFALLSLSILTTKQHYVVDLFAGLAVAALGIAVSLALRRRAGTPP